MDSQAVQEELQEEPSLKEKTAKGLFWGGISNFVQQVIGMAFGIAIARILSPDDYGLLAMLAIFTAIANTIMDSGFTTALINRKAIEHKDYNAVFWFNVFAAVGMYIILFFTAPLIARFYKQPILTHLSRFLFLCFIIAATGVAHNAFLLKRMMVKERGIIDMVSVFCSGAIGLILALNGFVFWGLAVQQLSQVFISVLLRWYYSPWRPTFKFDFSPLREMLGLSINILITNILAQVTANLFSVTSGRLFGRTITGYYTQGSKWTIIGSSVIIGSLNNVAHPAFVEAKDNIRRQLNMFRKMLRFGAFLIFPTLLGLAFSSKEFIWITLGEKWMGSVFVLKATCILGVNSYIISLYCVLLLSRNKSGIYMILMAVSFFFQSLCLLFFRNCNFNILLILYLGVNFLSFFCWHYYANKLIGIRLSSLIKDVFPYLISTCAAIGIALILSRGFSNPYVRLAVKISTMLIVYLTLLWITGSTLLKEAAFYLKYGKPPGISQK